MEYHCYDFFIALSGPGNYNGFIWIARFGISESFDQLSIWFLKSSLAQHLPSLHQKCPRPLPGGFSAGSR